MSLVFYDTETTGTKTFYDQVLQFAAIQTDEELNEIDRFEIRCRLLPHVVPAPGAMLVTGVNVSQLTNPSLPSHYEMVRAIREKLLSWSPTLFIGWNSIKFDEDLIRQALYKTLHNPYLTNSTGNSRSDAMRILQACSIFAPDALVFPIGDAGKQVFKLDVIAPANGFAHDRAHDAVGDVEATIFLCRLLQEKAPQIWSSFMRFSKKASVVDFINDERIFCLSEYYYGKPYSYIVTTIGNNRQNPAEWYVYDLSIAPESLLSLSESQLAERLTQSPKPLRRVKSNAAPMLFSAEEAPDICKGREHSMEELERRATVLQENQDFCKRLISAMESKMEEYPPSIHIESQIYDGFIEKPDEKLMDAFHDAEWSERYSIVEKFKDSRLRRIGRQLIYLERPELLDTAICLECELDTARRLLGHGDDIQWLTLPQALSEYEGILADSSGMQLERLRGHKIYLQKRHQHALSKLA